MPTPAPIDRDWLDEQCAGDGDLARELAGLFAAQVDRLAPSILAQAGDAASRADAAHTLRGAARAVGAGELADLLATYEDALRVGPYPSGVDTALRTALAAAAACARAIADGAV